MSKRLTLMWFFNNDCPYCTEIEDEVRQFAEAQDAVLVPVERGIRDEAGEPQVPGICFNHPKVANHVFIGRFCLDALRYVLTNG